MVLLEFVLLFCAGLLAGAEVLVRFGMRAPIRVVDERPQIEIRQALILRLRVLVPGIYLPTAALSITVAILDGTQGGFALRCLGLFALAVWTGTTFFGTVPINSAILTWRPDAPPTTWKAVIESWERLDTIRCWAALGAFASFLGAVALLRLTAN